MNYHSSLCRSCVEPIIWAKTPAGRTCPYDCQEVAEGVRYRLERVGPDGAGNRAFLKAVKIIDDPESILPPEPGHVSHFRTCPQASSWTKPRG